VLLKSAHTTSVAEFQQIMDVNLFSSFNVLKSSVKAMMRGGGGSIVFCSSAGKLLTERRVHCCRASSAPAMLLRCLPHVTTSGSAVKLAGEGVQCTFRVA
jgi:NAD(P)-dependent dehydrogenase (short-subunit alcohol dehydrogenase family)